MVCGVLGLKTLRDMRGYLEFLDEIGWLKRITVEASPILEIPEVLRRIMYRRGPALLFENVKGFPGWRIAGNLFCHIDVFRKSLGVERLEDVGRRLISLALSPPPMGVVDKIRAFKDMMSLSRYLPKKVGSTPIFENILEGDKASLNNLPVFKTWPGDGGRYFTYPLVITRDPDKETYNMGVYRVMILDDRRGVIHWQIHKRSAESYRKAGESGLERIPVAILIGGDPATLFTGAAPVPYPMDKYLFAGIVRGESLPVVELGSGLMVPAYGEAVLEGYIDVSETAYEGPFGDHMGYYDKPMDKYPIFHLECIYMRSDPIYYGSVVGKPALEDAVIGKAVERIFLPIIQMMFPEVVEINLPEHGVFQGLAIVSIKKRYPGHAKKVMMGLWGLGQFSLTKMIVVVDHDINPHDINQVIWAVSVNVDPQRDVLIIPGTHTDALDPATPIQGYGSKLGIDATRKYPEEYGGKEWPREVEVDEDTKRLVDEKWSLYGLDQGS